MVQVDLDLQLKGGGNQFWVISYEPGEILRGVLTIIPHDEFNCRHLYVRIEWHTEGRGTQVKQQISELDLFQGVLRAKVPTQYELSFKLPKEPWSYQGHYISIVWQLAIQLDVSWATDPQKIVPFVLQPLRASDER